jgi:hypothetical protein
MAGPTAIGSTPDGGTIIQDEDGSTHVLRGNSAEPTGPGVLDRVGKAFPEPLAAVGGAAQGFGFDVDSPAVQRAMADSPGIAGAASVPGATLMGAGRMAQKVVPSLETVGLFNPVTAPAAAAGLIAQKLFPGPDAPSSTTGPAGSPGQSAAPGAASLPPQPPQAPGSPQMPGAPPPINVRAPQVGTKDLTAAAQKEQEAAKALGEAGAAKAQGVGEETARAADWLGQARDQYLKRSQEIQAEGAARLQAMDREIEGIGKDQQKVDPERWWNSRTEGQKVMGTIALALGGFASAFGAENTGGKMISDAIARDVDAQRFNIQQASQNRRDKMAAQQSAFGHFLQLTGNEQAAQAAATAWGLQQANLKIEALKSSLSAPEERAKADATQAQIQHQLAMEKAKVVEINSNLTTQAQQQEAMRAQMAYQQQTRQMLTKGQIPPEMADRAIRLPDGRVVITSKPEEADKLRTIHRAASDIDDATGAMAKIVRENPVDVLRPGSKANREYNLAMDNVVNLVNPSKGINAQMQDPQRELYKHGLDPTVLGSTDALLGALSTFRSETKHSANKAFSLATGVTPFSEATPADLGFKPAGGR